MSGSPKPVTHGIAGDEPVLTLFSSGLLSKWGFDDGDAPDEYLDWLDEQGVGYPLDSWKRILSELVERYLVPVLDQQVTTVRIGTAHNPIRAQTVDDADAERWWHEHDGAPVLTPESVEIPFAEVARIAAEVCALEA